MGKNITSILCKKKWSIAGKTWHSPKIIFLKMSLTDVIESGESKNCGPGAQARVVYAVANVVLKKSKIVQRHRNQSTSISNDAIRRSEISRILRKFLPEKVDQILSYFNMNALEIY